MADTFDTTTRSWIMSRVASRGTAPELLVRRLVHRMGYRFRVCRQDLPGCPDVVFPRLRRVIFVHGCFWHGHNCPRGARVPKVNRAYWLNKIAGNQARDRKNINKLAAADWKPLVIWECETRDELILAEQLGNFLAKK